MRKCVPISSTTEEGFYEPTQAGHPRFLVFPRSDEGAAVALQLDASKDRPAFTALLLGKKAVGFGRRSAPFQMVVNIDDPIISPEDTLGSAKMTRLGIELQVKDARGQLGELVIHHPDGYVPKYQPKIGSFLRWRIERQTPTGTAETLFESHPRCGSHAQRWKVCH